MLCFRTDSTLSQRVHALSGAVQHWSQVCAVQKRRYGGWEEGEIWCVTSHRIQPPYRKNASVTNLLECRSLPPFCGIGWNLVTSAQHLAWESAAVSCVVLANNCCLLAFSCSGTVAKDSLAHHDLSHMRKRSCSQTVARLAQSRAVEGACLQCQGECKLNFPGCPDIHVQGMSVQVVSVDWIFFDI